MNSIEKFLAAEIYAVAGASSDRSKYGNIVFRKLLESGRTVYPINPHVGQVEGHQVFPQVSNLPEPAESLSIVTPPTVTRQIVKDAIKSNVKHIWMQPGAEDPIASQLARSAGINVIDDGSCVLVALA
jgi:uncharacterized protein